MLACSTEASVGKTGRHKKAKLKRVDSAAESAARFHDLTAIGRACFCCAQLAQKIKKGAHMRPHHA